MTGALKVPFLDMGLDVDTNLRSQPKRECGKASKSVIATMLLAEQEARFNCDVIEEDMFQRGLSILSTGGAKRDRDQRIQI